jgi:alpha-ketoglutarate-dependent taurine dioxygenase
VATAEATRVRCTTVAREKTMQITFEPLSPAFGTMIRGGRSAEILSLNVEEIIAIFKSRGLILFRGFEPDVEAFQTFTAQFTQEFLIHQNPLRRRIDAEGQTQTVQSDRSGIPLHGEMYYVPHLAGAYERPEILWFYCAQPAQRDGETLICDGVEVFAAFDQSLRDLFLKKKLKYSHRSPAKFWKTIAADPDQLKTELALLDGVVHCGFDRENALLWEYHVSAVSRTKYGNQEAFINSLLPPSNLYQVSFEDGTEISNAILDGILQTTDRLSVPLYWEAHDLAMVDNTRCMHGRRYNDEKRLIYVRMSKAKF